MAEPIDAEVEESLDFLPPFANDENKKINTQVKDIEKNLEKAEVALEENADRISIVQEHLKNVQQELKYTQSRLEAKNKEIETEDHLKALSDRERGRIDVDIGKLKKEREDLGEKINALQNEILRGNEKMDQFKLLMNWNQEELEQWALAERQKDEDNMAMEKYSKRDNSKIKELTLHIDKLTVDVQGKKDDLEREVTETQAAQIQLDRAADDFRRLHTERQRLIAQWDDAMAGMRNRDDAIAVASERFADVKAQLRGLREDLDTQARFLDDEQANNRELDARIALYEREVGKLRDTFVREKERAADAESEVEIIKGTLAKAANDMATQNINNDGAKTALEKARAKLDGARKQHVVVRRKLESEFTELDSLEAKVNELERMSAAEEARMRAVDREIKELKAEQFKLGQTLFAERGTEKTLISEIAGGQSQSRNLSTKIRGLDEQTLRQQELLYNVEFQLQQMERKVARAGGERSDEEMRALNARIEKLTSELEVVNSEHSMLLDQVKKAEDELGHERRHHGKLSKEKGKLDDDIAALQLETDMVGRAVRAATDTKENKMVENDVMKLEVKRLRDILNTHADEVFSLENRKFQLEISMQERRMEIDAHRDGLRAELKLVGEDIHRVTLELRERQLRVEKLEAKFGVLSTRGKPVGEDGEPHSQAYFIIKAAQEREELQREGDALDTKIRKAEKEVTALEGTLQKLQSVNTQYGKSFRRVNAKKAYDERAQLRDKLDHAYDKLKFRRNEERAISADIQQSEARLANLRAEAGALGRAVGDLEARHRDALAARDQQVERQERARNRAAQSVSDMRAAIGADAGAGETPHERDMKLAEIREGTANMLHELKVLALENPGAGIAEKLEALNIRLPASATARRAGSAAGSERSVSVRGSRPGSGRPPPVASIGE